MEITTKIKIEVLTELKDMVLQCQKEDNDAFTCLMIKHSNKDHEIYKWYCGILANLYETDPELVLSFSETSVVEDFMNKSWAPFYSCDYENRLKMLDYLINKFRTQHEKD